MTSVEFWTAVSAIGILLSAFVTTVTLIVIARQLTEARRASQANFINTLQKERQQYNQAYRTAKRDLSTLISANLDMADDYLDFFARVKQLIDVKVLPIEMVAQTFGYEFFLLTHNVTVQDKLLYAEAGMFNEIFAFHQQLTAFWLKRSKQIPEATTSLALRNPAAYQEGLATYRLLR